MSARFLLSIIDEFMLRVNDDDSGYGFSLLNNMSAMELESARARVVAECGTEVQARWLPLIRALRYPHNAGRPTLRMLQGGKLDAND